MSLLSPNYCNEPERRVRHLIREHGMPHTKIGAIIYSRKSWLEALRRLVKAALRHD